MRLSERVANAIVDDIVQQIVRPGDAVPNEAQLGERFDVSRTVVREGLKIVEQKGLVTIRQGDGTTVSPTDQWNLLDPRVLELVINSESSGTLRADVRDLRRSLESEMTRRASTKLSPNDIAALEAHVAAMDTATNIAELQRSDTAFHERIMIASGNRIGRAIVRLLITESRLEPTGSPLPSRAEYDQANREHRQIVELLKIHDGDGAAKVASNHVGHHWLMPVESARF